MFGLGFITGFLATVKTTLILSAIGGVIGVVCAAIGRFWPSFSGMAVAAGIAAGALVMVSGNSYLNAILNYQHKIELETLKAEKVELTKALAASKAVTSKYEQLVVKAKEKAEENAKVIEDLNSAIAADPVDCPVAARSEWLQKLNELQP